MPHERLPEIPINSIADFKKHILGEEGMEAKSWQQTVVHADGCTTNLGVIGATCNCGAERQAEISFKAGQDSVFNSIPENLPPLLEMAHRTGKAECKKELIEAGWKSPEQWQTEYLILERKAHSTGRREVIEEIAQRCHVWSEEDEFGFDLSAGDRVIYAHVWQALQHLEKGE
jgi:hypothetical protein